MSELLTTARRQSTPEERLLAVAERAREALIAHGRGPVAVRDEQRHTVGSVIPDADATEPAAVPVPGTPERGDERPSPDAHPQEEGAGGVDRRRPPLTERWQRESIDAGHPVRPA